MNLYDIKVGIHTYYYTTHKEKVTVRGVEYKPHRALERSSYKADVIRAKANITLTFPIDDTIFRPLLEPSIIKVSVKIATMDGTVFWRGEMITIESPDLRRILLTFQPTYLIPTALSERKMYQRNCPYVLYGELCKAPKQDFRAIVHSIDGDNIVHLLVPEPVNTRVRTEKNLNFVGGLIEIFLGGRGPDADTISFWISRVETPEPALQTDLTGVNNAHVYKYRLTIHTFRKVVGVQANTSVSMTPGCRRILQDCKNVHDNLKNYGGFPFIHTSPFEIGFAGD